MYTITVDPVLAQKAQAVFRVHGIELGDAVTDFLRNSIREMAEMDKMKEEELMSKHMRGLAEIEAGGGIHKSLAELERMAEDE